MKIKEQLLGLILQNNHFKTSANKILRGQEMEEYFQKNGDKPWFELMNIINREQFFVDVQSTFKLSLPCETMAKWTTFEKAVTSIQQITGRE